MAKLKPILESKSENAEEENPAIMPEHKTARKKSRPVKIPAEAAARTKAARETTKAAEIKIEEANKDLKNALVELKEANKKIRVAVKAAKKEATAKRKEIIFTKALEDAVLEEKSAEKIALEAMERKNLATGAAKKIKENVRTARIKILRKLRLAGIALSGLATIILGALSLLPFFDLQEIPEAVMTILKFLMLLFPFYTVIYRGFVALFPSYSIFAFYDKNLKKNNWLNRAAVFFSLLAILPTTIKAVIFISEKFKSISDTILPELLETFLNINTSLTPALTVFTILFALAAARYEPSVASLNLSAPKPDEKQSASSSLPTKQKVEKKQESPQPEEIKTSLKKLRPKMPDLHDLFGLIDNINDELLSERGIDPIKRKKLLKSAAKNGIEVTTQKLQEKMMNLLKCIQEININDQITTDKLEIFSLFHEIKTYIESRIIYEALQKAFKNSEGGKQIYGFKLGLTQQAKDKAFQDILAEIDENLLSECQKKLDSIVDSHFIQDDKVLSAIDTLQKAIQSCQQQKQIDQVQTDSNEGDHTKAETKEVYYELKPKTKKLPPGIGSVGSRYRMPATNSVSSEKTSILVTPFL